MSHHVGKWYQGRKCYVTVVKRYQGRKCYITVVKRYQGRKCYITVVQWYQGRKCRITVVKRYQGWKCYITNRKMISRWTITMVGSCYHRNILLDMSQPHQTIRLQIILKQTARHTPVGWNRPVYRGHYSLITPRRVYVRKLKGTSEFDLKNRCLFCWKSEFEF